MPIPRFLAPKPVPLDGPQDAAALGGEAPAQHRKTGFAIERQEQDNWCWSAVGVSVQRFYAPRRVQSQCALANAALERDDCCGGGGDDPSRCDRPWYLDRVLGITGNLEDMVEGTLPFADLRTRIDRGSVVGCRIGWAGGGGHFAVIVGWRISGDRTAYVDIADPIWMETQIPYGAFPSAYQSGGEWTHSYLTGPGTAGSGSGVAAIDDTGLLGA